MAHKGNASLAWFERRKKNTKATGFQDQNTDRVGPDQVGFLSDPGRWIAARARALVRSMGESAPAPGDDLEISLRLEEDFGDSGDETRNRD